MSERLWGFAWPVLGGILCFMLGMYVDKLHSQRAKPPGHKGLVLYSLWDDCVAISNDAVLFRSRTPKGMEDAERRKMMAHIKSIDGHKQ